MTVSAGQITPESGSAPQLIKESSSPELGFLEPGDGSAAIAINYAKEKCSETLEAAIRR